MKILSTMEGKFLEHLDRSGIFGEIMSYQDVYDSAPEDDLYDVLLIDVSDGKAEGLYTPRTLLGNGHKLPIIGILDDLEVESERGFEEAQATFIDQGGLYLLKSSSSPALLKACIAQAASIGKIREAQREPVRYFRDVDVELKIDLRSANVTVNKLPIHLTVHEYLVVELLAVRTGAVVTKEAFLGHLYSGFDLPEIKIVDVFLCKVRKKLGPASKFIETVWGRGYIMRETAEVQNAA